MALRFHERESGIDRANSKHLWLQPASPITNPQNLVFFVRTPFSIHQHGGFSSATDATRGAASASSTCSMRSVDAPRLNRPPFVVGVEHDDPAVVGSEKSEKHGAHAAGQLLGVFRHRSRAHEFTTSLLDIFHGGVQCHNHANHQNLRPQLSPRRTSNSARSRPTTTRRRRCDSSPSAPSAAASRRSST